MKVIYGQIAPVVGDLEANGQMILDAVAKQSNFDVILFPELALLGYPPLDLLNETEFIGSVLAAEHELIGTIQGMLQPGQCVIFGSITVNKLGLLNSAVIVHSDSVERRHKMLLPTYDVFDERRWFVPAQSNEPIMIAGEWCGVVICEDIWDDKRSIGYATSGPVQSIVSHAWTLNNADLTHLFVLNASPWHMGKNLMREELVSEIAKRYGIIVHYVNQVGGNDTLLFDGGSFRTDRNGTVVFRADLFGPEVVSSNGLLRPATKNPIADLNDALVMGIRDYMAKTGFTKAVIASSGGIDSAVVISLAEEALGRANVHTIAMPGPYSSDRSAKLAETLAMNLDVGFEVVDIRPMYEAAVAATGHFPVGVSRDVSDENIQARLRGMVAMKYSNRTGAIVLTTGNKSELAVGYCTLYGDMCGGLAVIGDVPKMLVYELARFINHNDGDIIPQEIIDRAPSAELAPDQKDSDSLPPYPILDAIVDAYLSEQFVQDKFAVIRFKYNIGQELIDKIVSMIDRNEYKRQQSAPVLKVTSKAFGIGRKRLITARWNHGKV